MLFAVNILDDVIIMEEVDGDKVESFIKFSNDLKGLKVRVKSLYNLA